MIPLGPMVQWFTSILKLDAINIKVFKYELQESYFESYFVYLHFFSIFMRLFIYFVLFFFSKKF